MTCREQYQLVLDRRQRCFNEYFEGVGRSRLHQDLHQKLLDAERLFSVVSERREYRLFEVAQQMLGDALGHVACSDYRLAFYSLRAFLELSLAAIRYSAYELELRQWEVGGKDVSWSLLTDDDVGCFSKAFVSGFITGLADECKHYQSLARRAYRKCSEYVHSNPTSHSSHGVLDEARIHEWADLFDAAWTSVVFAFAARYLSEISPTSIDTDLSDTLDTYLGHFEEVRNTLTEAANG